MKSLKSLASALTIVASLSTFAGQERDGSWTREFGREYIAAAIQDLGQQLENYRGQDLFAGFSNDELARIIRDVREATATEEGVINPPGQVHQHRQLYYKIEGDRRQVLVLNPFFNGYQNMSMKGLAEREIRSLVNQVKLLILREISHFDGYSTNSESLEKAEQILQTLPRAKWEKPTKLEDSQRAPVLLFEAASAANKVGYTWSEITRLCESQKELYEDRYFLVYCSFLDKNWQEIEIRSGTYTDYRFMGYSSGSSGGSQSKTWAGGGVYMKKSSSHHESWNEPVIVPVEVPYHYEQTVERQIFGLKIYGVGRLDQSLSWKNLVSTREPIVEGLAALRFKTAPIAKRECGKFVIRQETRTIKYHKAECFVASDAEGFFYEVRTRNPWVTAN